jgi:hypothetical protein
VPTAIQRRLLPPRGSISATMRHGQSQCPTKTSHVFPTALLGVKELDTVLNVKSGAADLCFWGFRSTG